MEHEKMVHIEIWIWQWRSLSFSCDFYGVTVQGTSWIYTFAYKMDTIL